MSERRAPVAEALSACFVLAAGLGTRLAPLTLEVPKPLLWVGDRPQIEHVFAHLAREGLAEVVINTHHLAEQFSDAWCARQPVRVVRVREELLLGTGGALVNAASVLGSGDVLLWNADMLGEPDLASLVDAHHRSGAAATLLVGPATGPGTVGIDEAGVVRRLRTLSQPGEVEGVDYHGVAVLSPRLRARLRAPGCLVEDGLIPALSAGDRVIAVRGRAPLADIGTSAALLDANMAWLSSRGRTSLQCKGSLVSAGAALDRVVVARGARVGAARLTEVVVLPEAVVPDGADLRRAFVAPSGVVEV